MPLSTGDAVLLATAGFGAGAVNAVAGGGSLISFPALLAAGYPSVTANVTNAVALVPGYLGGTLGYRPELKGQRSRAVALGAGAGLGAAAGAAVLLVTSAQVFASLVPFLVLGACALLAVEPLLRRHLPPPDPDRPAEHRVRLHLATFAAGFYGGYFGGGLGILLLAILGLALRDGLQRLNALKGLLALVVGVVSAAAFAAFGPVAWGAAGIMVVASLAGGNLGVRLARRLSPAVLRTAIVIYGVGVGIALLVT